MNDSAKAAFFLCGLAVLSWIQCAGPFLAEPTIGYLYVDATAGSDESGNGSPSKPFRTIARALSVDDLSERTVISVAPGAYDSALGESFPIVLNRSVRLTGDPDSGGIGTTISGGGNYPPAGSETVAVVCGNCSMEGFTVNNAAGIAVWCEGNGSVLISKNTLSGSMVGILAAGESSPQLEHNTITGNTVAGVQSADRSKPVVRRNEITGNAVGILASNFAKPDIGSPNSLGDNTVRGNTYCDLHNATPEQLTALGNTWDEDPYLFDPVSACSLGADITNSGGGSVLYQYAPPSDQQLIPAEAWIELLAPSRGSVIGTTTEPSFNWEPTGSQLMIVAVFARPIVVANGRVTNGDQLVWAWHTGLANVTEGFVDFVKGVSSIEDGAPPVPLAKGHTYFWACWAWDVEGMHVARCSAQSYFTIGNF